MHRLLIINPGSTSTKTAVYEDETCLWRQTIDHPPADLNRFFTVSAQASYRREKLLESLAENGFALSGFSAIVARGGLLRPLAGGVYLIDKDMYADLSDNRYGEHASNLGGIIARELASELGVTAMTVDPVSVDEFDIPARFSGLKGLSRISLSHALNTRAVAHKVAAALETEYDRINLVVAHLGSGISVSAHRQGRMVDVNNANNEGPFSLERCGTLPALGLIDLCFSGAHTRQQIVDTVTRRGGIYSYLGTKDFRSIDNRIRQGDEDARQVVGAMCYQVAKEIGAMSAVLEGRVSRVVLTGGMAFSDYVTDQISRRVSFIAPVLVLPGEEEMEALALGALRVLQGREQIRRYGTDGE